MLTTAISQQNIPRIKQTPELKIKRQRSGREYPIIKRKAEEILNALKSYVGDPLTIKVLLLLVVRGIHFKRIKFSQEYVAKVVGCEDRRRAGEIIHLLYELGVVHISGQRWKKDHHGTCAYTLMDSCFSAELVEFFFYVARAYKKVTFFMLSAFKKALSFASSALLSYPSTFYNQSLMHSPSVTRQNQSSRLETQKESLQRGKAMPITKEELPYTIDHDKKEIRRNSDKVVVTMEQIKDLELMCGYKWIDEIKPKVNEFKSLFPQPEWSKLNDKEVNEG